ncbi:hypothetical protein FHU41_001269 [Psychromicrobium silvestre]|uniref:Uncharacterized protein n=1 Tax=Psychromicrobium silvestre TaxID=1645614 RepID=A0A7Y9LT02_9MICC|nr:hypothetical protein [Psychromicrobium silvestre]NYE95048.1 hypothetical protein [Psychromicrobium silvestre]
MQWVGLGTAKAGLHTPRYLTTLVTHVLPGLVAGIAFLIITPANTSSGDDDLSIY